MSGTRLVCWLSFAVLPLLAGCTGGRSLSVADVPPAEYAPSDESAVWSPDGSRMVFISSHPYVGDDLLVMDADGSRQRLLLSAYSLSDPAWSPDGAWIAVSSSGDYQQGEGAPFAQAVAAAHEIYVVAAGGGGVRRLTNDDCYDRSPAWSPDGTRLAYAKEETRLRDVIYVARLDGAVQFTLPGGNDDPPVSWGLSHAWDPSWSPDGKRLAYSTDWDIWSANTDGTGVMPLLVDPDASDLTPRWSPDGRLIAWWRLSLGGQIDWLCVMNADGTGVVRLLTGVSWLGDTLSWSPDSRRIVCAAGRYGFRDLCLVRADGSGVTWLEDDGADSYQPAWSPDGSRIAFSSNRSGAYRIWTIHPDGTGLTNLSDRKQ